MMIPKITGVAKQIVSTGLAIGFLAGAAAFAWMCLNENFFHLQPDPLVISLKIVLNQTIPLAVLAAIFLVAIYRALASRFKSTAKIVFWTFSLAFSITLFLHTVGKASWGERPTGAGVVIIGALLAIIMSIFLFLNPPQKLSWRRGLTLLVLTILLAVNVISRFIPRPNIILITMDTTRAESLRLYGGTATTSVLEALAEKGFLFEQAIAPSQCTNPSHASIFTGFYPKTHQVYNNETRLADGAQTLAEIFRESGYLTLAAVSARHINPSNSGFDQGFQKFLTSEPFKMEAGERNRSLLPLLARLVKQPWPFFLWVHYFDPHGPYLNRPSSTTAEQPLNVKWKEEMNVSKPEDGLVNVSEQRRRYLGEIEYMDAAIGQLTNLLERSGQFDNSLIAIVGDHGESLGEHEIYFSHSGSFRQVTQVPLLITGHGIPRGKTDRLVTIIDLFPTLLEAGGLTPEPQQEGKSLLSLIRGESTDHHDFVFMEAVDGTLRGIFTPRWRYIKGFPSSWSMKTPYLMPADEAAEQKNLAQEHPEVASTLDELLQGWLSEEPIPPFLSEQNVPDEKITEALKALGYLQ